MKVINKEDFESFVDYLINEHEKEIVGVQEKGKDKYSFQELHKAEDLRLDYDVTILPPKKYFMPQRETLVKYKTEEELSMSPVNEVTPRIIIGIHPYDLVSIKQMDKIFEDTHEDQNYLWKRREAVLIGVNMKNVSEWSFAASMGTATVDDGYDLMLTDIGDQYAVEIGSTKGSDLMDKKPDLFEDAKPEDVERYEEEMNKLEDKFEKSIDFSKHELPYLLAEAYHDEEFWEEHSDECLSCGTCNLVCPTCYCFDVQDINDVGAEEGERLRQWDGCMLQAFARVAGGENFREEKAGRYRHRYMRKGRYIYDKYGDIACVGCGRCSSQCLPDIADPSRIYNDIKERIE
ncbi:MAG: 4Fe-4S dicluster domain-containing protein [Thermoplasmatota archaeon]